MASKNQLRRSLIVLAAIAPLAVLLTLGVEKYQRESRRRGPTDAPPPETSIDASASPSGILDTPAVMGQISESRMVEVDEIELDDEKQIVAIQVGDQHLAYPLDFMAGQGAHISNACFGVTPITVAYCDQTDVVRVLTSSDKDVPLEISQNGMLNGELALLYDQHAYQLSLDTIPLAQLPYKRLSWGKWKTDHPEGRVFTGLNWDTIEASQPDSN